MAPRHPRLYLVTDRTRTRGRPLLEMVEATLRSINAMLESMVGHGRRTSF